MRHQHGASEQMGSPCCRYFNFFLVILNTTLIVSSKYMYVIPTQTSLVTSLVRPQSDQVFSFGKIEFQIKLQRPAMTIQISEDWFNNNISGQEGYTLDSENGVFTKTIPEADLTFEFSTDGEFKF